MAYIEKTVFSNGSPDGTHLWGIHDTNAFSLLTKFEKSALRGASACEKKYKLKKRVDERHFNLS